MSHDDAMMEEFDRVIRPFVRILVILLIGIVLGYSWRCHHDGGGSHARTGNHGNAHQICARTTEAENEGLVGREQVRKFAARMDRMVPEVETLFVLPEAGHRL